MDLQVNIGDIPTWEKRLETIIGMQIIANSKLSQDHDTMHRYCTAARARIDELEAENTALKEKLSHARVHIPNDCADPACSNEAHFRNGLA